MNGPLAGVRVVDLSQIVSGPMAACWLADQGADVIKVEPPAGDPVRGQGAMVDGYSWYFAQFNRNKKSVVLDLYTDEGKADLTALLAGVESDVHRAQDLGLAGKQRVSEVFRWDRVADDYERLALRLASGESVHPLGRSAHRSPAPWSSASAHADLRR